MIHPNQRQTHTASSTNTQTGRAVLASLQAAGRASGEALGRVYARVLEACVPEGQWQVCCVQWREGKSWSTPHAGWLC